MRLAGNDRWTRALLRAGLAAGPLFVTVFSVDGASRAGYRSRRHPVSSLALGSRGWVQTSNFAVTGVLYLGSAAALSRTSDLAMSRRTGPALVGAAAAGIIGAAVFRTDPVSGYPPGTPDVAVHRTAAGTLHDLAAIPTFLGLPLAAASYAWRFARSGYPGWAAYSASTTLAMLATCAASGAGFNQAPRLVDSAGYWQRLCIATGFTWLTALTGRALQRS